ncbi:MAG: ADP-ribosylation factor-like protein [Candidatus Thorarchaeota archaeon]
MLTNSKDTEFRNDPGTNHLKDILQFKIVYWGPGESGKTTSYYRLREKFSGVKLNKGYSIETTDGRTLWQDSVRLSFFLNIGESKYNIITQIVTATGQERFLSTREYVLGGADGVIFVADSNLDKMEQNKRSFRELLSFTNERRVPFLIQLNKRDLSNAIDLKRFRKEMALPEFEAYEDGSLVIYPTVALDGKMVIRCFEDLMFQIILNYFSRKIR